MLNFRSGFFALVLVMFAVTLGRVVLSFGLVGGAVSYALSQAGNPLGNIPVGLASLGGLDSLANLVAPSAGRQRVYSVLDVPSELEALSKSRGARLTAGGALIVPVGE